MRAAWEGAREGLGGPRERLGWVVAGESVGRGGGGSNTDGGFGVLQGLVPGRLTELHVYE